MASAEPEISIAHDAAPATVAPSQTPAPKAAAKKVAVAPPGYKLVKVRKPDGSIVTVKRKLSPEELAATSAATPSNATATTPAAKLSNATTTKPAAIPSDTTAAKPAASPNNATTTTPNTGSTPEASVAAVPKSPVAPSSPAVAKSPLAEAAAASSLQTEVSQTALDEQAMAFREKRMSRFKNGMIRGLANVVSHSLPGIDIGEWHNGDEEVDYGSDMDSDFDPDDDDHLPSDDHHQEGDKHVEFQSGVAANAVAATMTAPPQHPVTQPRATQPPGKQAEKETYKLSIKELNAIEEKAVEDEQPLRRHWANFSFYLMASLSIVLPVVFMILGIFIILINGKSTTGPWRKLPDAVKVAVSAWPIVFAAVVAQVFKAFATFRVERGIKLMRLEQLMGSNSFGNAMKQPLLLRRLDLITLTLFLVWCLSPLGSQAVQRCYYTQQNVTTWTNETVRFLDTTRLNQMFSSGNTSNITTNPGRANQLQLLSTYYNAAFLPASQSENNHEAALDEQDRYDNPFVPLPSNGGSTLPYASAYGLSFFLPENQASSDDIKSASSIKKNYKDEVATWDSISFTMNATYYNLTCGEWKQITSGELGENFHGSSNNESAFTMTDISGQNRTHYLAFASENRIPIPTNGSTDERSGDNRTYSMIECTYQQVYVEWEVDCYRDGTNGAQTEPQCFGAAQNDGPSKVLSPSPNNYALVDFSKEFMDYTTAGGSASFTSPTERYLVNGTVLDVEDINPSTTFNLSAMTNSVNFQNYFGLAFNTWVMLGYCPECLKTGGTVYSPDDPDFSAHEYLYSRVSKPQHQFSNTMVYRLAVPWVVLYWFCCATLLIAGIISVWLESVTVAPDVMGYASSVARNSKYLHLPKTNSTMSAGQRLQKVGGMQVMMQDVKADKEVGKIALGMKFDGAKRLQPNRLYR